MDNFVITLLKMCTMLFVVIDPIGNMPIFMSLTNSPRQGYRAEVAKRSVLIGFIVLIFFAFAGEAFLNSLQISLPAFRIAGGIMLFIVGLQMIFTNIEKPHADDGKDQLYGGVDVAVFPLAVPLIAGPGTIASIILMMSEAIGKPIEQCSIIIDLIAILILSYILFRLCDLFARLFGQTINNVISKILGIVLGALASQFVIDGIKALI